MTTQIRPRISTRQLAALGNAAEIAIDNAPVNDPRIYIWEAIDTRLRAERIIDGKQARPRLGLGEIEATADIVRIARTHEPESEYVQAWIKLERRMRKELCKAARAIVENAGGTVTGLDCSEAAQVN